MKRVGVALVVIGLAAMPVKAFGVPGPPQWATRHGLAKEAFNRQDKAYKKSGFRLEQVSGYVDGGALRYAALWRQVPSPKWTTRVGQDKHAFDASQASMKSKHYRVAWIDGYTVGGTPRYATVWDASTGPKQLVRVGLSQGAFQQLFDKKTTTGWRLTHISGYPQGGSAHYAVTFEKTTAGPAGITLPDESAPQYRADYTKYIGQGFTLKEVSGFSVGGEDRYAAIWEKTPEPVVRARNGIALDDYQRISDTDNDTAYYPTYVQAFTSGSTARFNTIALNPMSQADLDTIRNGFDGFLAKHHVAGLSLAITKDDRLVYASGFGDAVLPSGSSPAVPMDVDHRLRIGSISKTITSSAIYRLLQTGKIPNGGISRHVLGPDGVLPGIKVPQSMKSIEGATVAQFLEHQSGVPGDLPDPVDCSKPTLNGRLQAVLFQNAAAAKTAGVPAVDGLPGQHDQYSNYSHNLMGQAVAKLAGTSYQRYVLRHVFKPAGITAPRLFHDGPYDPSTGEAGAYNADGSYAEYNDCDGLPPGIGAGGWSMSARDLVRYLVSVDDNPARNILDPSNYQQMLTIVPPTMDPNPSSYNYAKSWVVGGLGFCGYYADTIQGHNGGLAGGWGELHSLTNGYAFAVLGNQAVGSGTCTPSDDGSPPPSCAADECAQDATAILLSMLDKVDWTDADLFGS